METIAIYAEHCTRAGNRCYKDEPGDDATFHPVTVEEYKRLRRAARHAPAGRDLYLRRAARAVMDALR